MRVAGRFNVRSRYPNKHLRRAATLGALAMADTFTSLHYHLFLAPNGAST